MYLCKTYANRAQTYDVEEVPTDSVWAPDEGIQKDLYVSDVLGCPEMTDSAWQSTVDLFEGGGGAGGSNLPSHHFNPQEVTMYGWGDADGMFGSTTNWTMTIDWA